MLVWLGIIFTIAIVSVVIKQSIGAATIRSVSEEWCALKGVDLLDLTVESHPSSGRHSRTPGELIMRIRRRSTGEVEIWKGTWEIGFFRAQIAQMNPVGTLREPGWRQLSTPEFDPAVNPEAVILAEVARRIDQITGQPGWAQAHDLDGSGHIDDAEFRALRERVMAEVRAEFQNKSGPG